MKTDDIALDIKKVSKEFVLNHEKTSSVKSKIVNIFKDKKNNTTNQVALNNIDFQINKGDFFGILGRNGSGKSTMLKILAGIYQPTSGKVIQNGKLIPFIELGVGFNPELTGRENVYLNGALFGFSHSEIDEKYEDIVKFSELEGFMDQKLKNYSSGMQVRLAFAIATHAEADILLVDEVLAVGDADFQRKCYQFFQSLKKQKKTVVFVSHDMSAVREFCNKAILIESSEIIASGDGDEVATRYQRLFIDEDDISEFLPQSGKRWGDGRITFTEVKVVGNKTINDNNKELLFKSEFVAHKDMDMIVTGSSIMNASGEEVCGTNTEHRKIKIKNIKKGQKFTVNWNYPNIFTDGNYQINVSLHGSNSELMADWWEGAESFGVRREEKAPFIVTPDIKVSVERE